MGVIVFESHRPASYPYNSMWHLYLEAAAETEVMLCVELSDIILSVVEEAFKPRVVGTGD